MSQISQRRLDKPHRILNRALALVYDSDTYPVTTKAPKRDFILLVEDDPDDELIALRTFPRGHFGVDIVVVRDGAEALDFLFAEGAHARRDPSLMPSRIFLDLYLPKLNGLEVLQRIKTDERTKSIPVTMLTGSDYEVLMSETLRRGAEACLTKPVTWEGIRLSAAPGSKA